MVCFAGGVNAMNGLDDLIMNIPSLSFAVGQSMICFCGGHNHEDCPFFIVFAGGGGAGE